MRLAMVALAVAVCLGTAQAQRHKITINAETPEGQALQQIGTEEDAAKKLGLMEQFAAKYPKHEAIAWVYEQMVAAYAAAGNLPMASEVGDKLLAIDPEDVESAHTVLKAAEAKKDPDAILKWSAATSEAARKVAGSAKPKDEDEVEDWKRRVDFAKQVEVYTEYSLFAAALQTTDAQKKLMLAQALEKRNPDSQYYPQTAEHVFLALLQAGKSTEATTLAESYLAKHPGTPEMLLTVALSHLAKQQPGKALEYAGKANEALGTAKKPEGVSDADWQTRQAALKARTEWVMGVTYATENKWSQADKTLRSALPGIQSDKAMLAEALFYLGLANYNLGEAGDTDRIKDALKFNQQCAAIPGPYQSRANTNIRAIRSKYSVR